MPPDFAAAKFPEQLFRKEVAMNRRTFCSLMMAVAANVCLFGCTSRPGAISYSRDVRSAGQPGLPSPNAIVVFDSWSGNTKAIAETMAQSLGCAAMPVDEAFAPSMGEYDLLLVGSPVHGGMPTGKIERFLSEIEVPRASAVFVTYGAPLFGPHTANTCLDSMAEKLGGTCFGTFKCHGFHQIFRTYPDHPDETDRADATRFATGLLERCCSGVRALA